VEQVSASIRLEIRSLLAILALLKTIILGFAYDQTVFCHFILETGSISHFFGSLVELLSNHGCHYAEGKL
jgi:hypothetical protein